MEVRKIIIADRQDGMTINAISQAVRVSESAIYRLFQKERDTGSIEPSYQNCGRPSEVNTEKLNDMEELVTRDPDITLSEIKEKMHLSIKESAISHILRNKLGFRFKKRWYMPVKEIDQTL